VFFARVKKDLKNHSIHAYSTVYVVYGRKPTLDETLSSVEATAADERPATPPLPEPPSIILSHPQEPTLFGETIEAAAQHSMASGDVQPTAATDTDKRRRKQPPGGCSVKKKFACPFYKKSPEKHNTWTSCPGPGWDEVHRVKYVKSCPSFGPTN